MNVYRDAKMRILVIGNGESRAWFKPCHQMMDTDVVTWGCNALYRDGSVDNLVAVDYGMQQEIYNSGYVQEHECWFTDWNILPAAAAEGMIYGFDIPEEGSGGKQNTSSPNTRDTDIKEENMSSTTDQKKELLKFLSADCDEDVLVK